MAEPFGRHGDGTENGSLRIFCAESPMTAEAGRQAAKNLAFFAKASIKEDADVSGKCVRDKALSSFRWTARMLPVLIFFSVPAYRGAMGPVRRGRAGRPEEQLWRNDPTHGYDRSNGAGIALPRCATQSAGAP